MPTFDRLLPDVMIENVSFSEHALQITYFERTDLTEYVSVQKAMLIDVEHITEEVDELQDLLREIVDKALVLKRNPPKRLKRRSRPRSEEEDDDEADSVEEDAAPVDTAVDAEGSV